MARLAGEIGVVTTRRFLLQLVAHVLPRRSVAASLRHATLHEAIRVIRILRQQQEPHLSVDHQAMRNGHKEDRLDDVQTTSLQWVDRYNTHHHRPNYNIYIHIYIYTMMQQPL